MSLRMKDCEQTSNRFSAQQVCPSSKFRRNRLRRGSEFLACSCSLHVSMDCSPCMGLLGGKFAKDKDVRCVGCSWHFLAPTKSTKVFYWWKGNQSETWRPSHARLNKWTWMNTLDVVAAHEWLMQAVRNYEPWTRRCLFASTSACDIPVQ